jgi:hypothetical protein
MLFTLSTQYVRYMKLLIIDFIISVNFNQIKIIIFTLTLKSSQRDSSKEELERGERFPIKSVDT